MPSLNLRRVFIIASVLSLIVIYVFLWLQMIRNESLRTGADFMAFYAVGRISFQKNFASAYDLAQQKITEETVAGFTVDKDQFFPFGHPPFILPILALFGQFDYLTAFGLWAIWNIILLIASTYLLAKLIPQATQTRYWILTVGASLFFPSFVSILNGQDSALLLLGATLWLYGFTRKDDRLTGLGLAFTTIRPHIAILLAIPFIFNQRHVWWWFCAGAAALVGFSIALIGFSGTRAFISILGVSATGEGYKINESAMFNVIGLLNRTFPSLNQEIARSAGWGIYVVALLGLIILWAKSPKIHEAHLGTAVIVSLLAAPHLHYHDLALLLIPLIIALRIGLTRGLFAVETAVILPLAAALIFLVSNLTPALQYSIPYVVMLFWAFWLWRPDSFQRFKIPYSK